MMRTLRSIVRWSMLIGFSANVFCIAAGESPTTFTSPQEAVQALVQAAKRDKTAALLKVLGPDGKDIVESGDPSDDQVHRQEFLRLADEHVDFMADPADSGKMMVTLGKENWPFPIPLVRGKDNRWQFDAEQGRTEILARRIGGNELNAVEICRAYVEAQTDYAEKHSQHRVPEYAQKIKSSPGKQDGLYWDTAAHVSPPGVPKDFAIAAPTTGDDTPEPYHGYYFRILTAQGADAKGGKLSYIVKGSMLGGFALVAWPAKYGVSGVQTFIVNHDGTVYEKHLGEDTDKAARAMTEYNPDTSWRPVAAD